MTDGTSNKSGSTSTNKMSSSSESNKTESGSGGTQSEGLKSAAIASVHDVKDGVKHLADDLVSTTKKGAESRIEAGKTRAGEGLGSVANALRKTGEQLRAEDNDAFSSYIDTAAQKIDGASTYLKDRSLTDIAGDMKQFARREPALFLGGALVLGLIGGRFLKSSSPESSDAEVRGDTRTAARGQGPRPGQRPQQNEPTSIPSMKYSSQTNPLSPPKSTHKNSGESPSASAKDSGSKDTGSKGSWLSQGTSGGADASKPSGSGTKPASDVATTKNGYGVT